MSVDHGSERDHRASGEISLEEQIAAVRRSFVALTGADPAGVWAAPGRINLIGEHTDYNDGFVLPLAIDRYVVAAAAPRTDGVLRLYSLQQPGAVVEAKVAELEPGALTGWAAYPAGAVWALAADGVPVGGADLVLDGAVPVGSGLSSSAALECAAALAVAGVYGISLPPDRLARLAQRAENAFVGVPCGAMDQLASAYGRAGEALFIDIRELSVEPCRFDPAAAGLRLLAINTKVSHQLGDGEYAKRRATCEAAAQQLGVAALRDVAVADVDAACATLDPLSARRVRHVVTENARVVDTMCALSAGAIQDIGPLMTASHLSLRDDYEVSCPELDTAVDAALAAGALGARMTGGGFGGCAIALVPLDREAAVIAGVADAFSRAGFAAPDVFPAVPADGAHAVP